MREAYEMAQGYLNDPKACKVYSPDSSFAFQHDGVKFRERGGQFYAAEHLPRTRNVLIGLSSH